MPKEQSGLGVLVGVAAVAVAGWFAFGQKPAPVPKPGPAAPGGTIQAVSVAQPAPLSIRKLSGAIIIGSVWFAATTTQTGAAIAWPYRVMIEASGLDDGSKLIYWSSEMNALGNATAGWSGTIPASGILQRYVVNVFLKARKVAADGTPVAASDASNANYDTVDSQLNAIELIVAGSISDAQLIAKATALTTSPNPDRGYFMGLALHSEGLLKITLTQINDMTYPLSLTWSEALTWWRASPHMR